MVGLAAASAGVVAAALVARLMTKPQNTYVPEKVEAFQ